MREIEALFKIAAEASRKWRVLLDDSEASVKDIHILATAGGPLCSPERTRTKALEISR